MSQIVFELVPFDLVILVELIVPPIRYLAQHGNVILHQIKSEHL